MAMNAVEKRKLRAAQDTARNLRGELDFTLAGLDAATKMVERLGHTKRTQRGMLLKQGAEIRALRRRLTYTERSNKFDYGRYAKLNLRHLALTDALWRIATSATVEAAKHWARSAVYSDYRRQLENQGWLSVGDARRLRKKAEGSNE